MDIQKTYIPKAILFDLDGTLYAAKKMQVYMLFKICAYLLMHPYDWKIVPIISIFRKEREYHAGEKYTEPYLLKEMQFQWVADKLRLPIEKVRGTIETWMYTVPLKYIKACKYKEVDIIFNMLKEKGISYAVVSDYPVEEKLKAMQIKVPSMISALDTTVNALKPSPIGFIHAAEQLGHPISECWIVGDRDDRDGAAARSVGTIYIQGLKTLLTKLQELHPEK